jgi:hypothetical protein
MRRRKAVSLLHRGGDGAGCGNPDREEAGKTVRQMAKETGTLR